MKIWYCITEIFNDDNTINKAITDVIEADERPQSTHECISDKTGYKEVYKDWFAYHGTATVEELRAEMTLVNTQQRGKYIGQECGSDVYFLAENDTELVADADMEM